MSLSLVSNTTITKFVIEGKVVYAKINWERNENIVFQIKIFDDANSWSGSFSKQFAEECRKDVEENVEEYYENVKMCLSNICDNYVYELTYKPEDTDVATFKWKKNFEGTTTKLIHGSVNLYRDAVTESKDTITDFLINEIMMQKKRNEESHNYIEQLKSEIENLKAELTKLIDMKNSLEDNLYGKFVSLLNTKKRRIQVLEDHLHKCESN